MKILKQLTAAIFAGLHSSGQANWEAITEDKPEKKSLLKIAEYGNDKVLYKRINKHEELNKWKQPSKCQN